MKYRITNVYSDGNRTSVEFDLLDDAEKKVGNHRFSVDSELTDLEFDTQIASEVKKVAGSYDRASSHKSRISNIVKIVE